MTTTNKLHYKQALKAFQSLFSLCYTCSVDFVRIGAVGLPTDEVNFCGDNNFVQTDPSTRDTLYNNG